MADIYILPNSITEADSITTSTALATNPGRFLLDNNKQSYWSSTNAAATQDLTLDFGSTILEPDRCIIYHHTTDAVTAQVQYEDSGWQAGSATYILTSAANTPVTAFDITTGSSADWRIHFTNTSARFVKVAVMYIGTEVTFPTLYNYGTIIKEPQYATVALNESYGGTRRAIKRAESRNRWELTYEGLVQGILVSPEWSLWAGVMAVSDGMTQPVWYVDPNGNEYLVRIIQPSLGAIQHTANIWNIPKIILEEEL